MLSVEHPSLFYRLSSVVCLAAATCIVAHVSIPSVSTEQAVLVVTLYSLYMF